MQTTDIAQIAAKLSEIDRERLSDLIAGYEQVRPYREPHEGDRFGVAPIDCGGTDGSDHSYRFSKLVKLGLAETRKRGLGWGQKASKRCRGSNVYRPTPLGQQVRALLQETPNDA